ncbi:SOS response-associated peptidase family protein [Xanthomonas axonopodis]
MCYSAEVWADYHLYVEEFGADIDIKEFVKLYLGRQDSFKWKIPKGMDRAFDKPKSDLEKQIHSLIQDYKRNLISESEQNMFAQKKRLADAERKLAVKETKTALNEQRIAGNKIKQYKRWIEDAKRTELDAEKDNRIWPDSYAPVLIVENGKKIVRPMRYHCRPAGHSPSIDRTKDGKVSGTYNARRDNLTRFWKKQFGYTHGLMVASQFYEMVERDGVTKEVQFNPSTHEPMFIACLWSHWVDPTGKEPDLYSFAAITDDPEPEVAEAGHDRTVINLKPEHVDAWLNPDPKNLEAMQAILDDKQHPFYEHRLAA